MKLQLKGGYGIVAVDTDPPSRRSCIRSALQPRNMRRCHGFRTRSLQSLASPEVLPVTRNEEDDWLEPDPDAALVKCTFSQVHAAMPSPSRAFLVDVVVRRSCVQSVASSCTGPTTLPAGARRRSGDHPLHVRSTRRAWRSSVDFGAAGVVASDDPVVVLVPVRASVE